MGTNIVTLEFPAGIPGKISQIQTWALRLRTRAWQRAKVLRSLSTTSAEGINFYLTALFIRGPQALDEEPRKQITVFRLGILSIKPPGRILGIRAPSKKPLLTLVPSSLRLSDSMLVLGTSDWPLIYKLQS